MFYHLFRIHFLFTFFYKIWNNHLSLLQDWHSEPGFYCRLLHQLEMVKYQMWNLLWRHLLHHWQVWWKAQLQGSEWQLFAKRGSNGGFGGFSRFSKLNFQIAKLKSPGQTVGSSTCIHQRSRPFSGLVFWIFFARNLQNFVAFPDCGGWAERSNNSAGEQSLARRHLAESWM